MAKQTLDKVFADLGFKSINWFSEKLWIHPNGHWLRRKGFSWELTKQLPDKFVFVEAYTPDNIATKLTATARLWFRAPEPTTPTALPKTKRVRAV